MGFLVLGLSDLLVDLIWLLRAGRRLFIRQAGRVTIADLRSAEPGRVAVFIPAWDEAEVIGPMLRHALATYDYPDFRLYVGAYPNDPATLKAIAAVKDTRIRLVVNRRSGPTTKADALNQIWLAMREDEAADARPFRAVVLHDAEDVVHRDELTLVDALIDRIDLVQMPVLPLIDAERPWVSGHYADEFAEAHGKELVVREAVGAAVPSAGVSTGISPAALRHIAEVEGTPFDAASVTEDYELGLKLKAYGFRTAFVRMRDTAGDLIGTRAYFPATVGEAVRQKSRWILGTALSGWDRMAWRGGLTERWMRVRDRQAPLAAVIILIGYAGAFLWLVLMGAAVLLGGPGLRFTPAIDALITANFSILVWRAFMRAAFTARLYGPLQGCLAIPRMAVSNLIAVASARAALQRHIALLRGERADWGKTRHVFPDTLP